MNLSDTVHLALRNLRQAKLRTALTTMGVSIGIASLAGMVSLGVGLQDQVVGRFTQSGVFDAITVTPTRQLTGRFGLGGRGASARGRIGGARGRGVQLPDGAPAVPDKPAPALDDAAIKAIAALEYVKDVYPNIRVPVELSYEQSSDFAVASGVPMSAKDEGAFQTMTYGAFFSNETDRACLLTLDLAKRITDREPQTLIGQALHVSYASVSRERVEAAYTIVGIVERDPGGFGGGGLSGFMIPLAIAREISANAVANPQALVLVAPEAGGKKEYSSLTVKVTRAQFTQDVEDRVTALGYSAFSLTDVLKQAKRAFILLDIVLSLIGSIALAVSSLGIVNTMVMSILERTREIGIMKALGGSDSDVRGIFLVEASAIGVMGGIAGVALGWTVGRVINIGANYYIQSQGGTPGNLFSLPFWLIGGAIGFSLVVSLIAGSYPAARAAKLDPIQALRHD